MNVSKRMSAREQRIWSVKSAQAFDMPFVLASADPLLKSRSLPAMSPHFINTSADSSAFSLIETVLAIGVVAFALLGIVGLFSSSMKNNRDSLAQQESFHAARMITSRMQDTNFFLPKSLGALQAELCPSGFTNYYLYTVNEAIVLTNSPTYGLTNGTMYCVQMRLSENLLSITNAFPISAGGAPSSSDWKNWPGLPLSVRVYTLPNAALVKTITNTLPVMTFDMVIPR